MAAKRWLLVAVQRAHRWNAAASRRGNRPRPQPLDWRPRKLVPVGLGSRTFDFRWSSIGILRSRAFSASATPDSINNSAADVNHNKDQQLHEAFVHEDHRSIQAESQDPHSTAEEDPEARQFIDDFESLRISMSKLRTSLWIMGTIQVVSSSYIFYTGFASGKLFLRLGLFMVLVPLSLAILLPFRSLKRLVLQLLEAVKEGEASKLNSLLKGGASRIMTSYFRKADVVISLSALVLLLASMYEMFFSYIAGTIAEAGDKLEKLAKEDVEKVASFSKSQQGR